MVDRITIANVFGARTFPASSSLTRKWAGRRSSAYLIVAIFAILSHIGRLT
jgi:hypothetical protein